MAYHHLTSGHESENARGVTHEIEHELAQGHNLKSTLHEEIHKLRHLDSSHGNLNRPEFQADLKYVNHELHRQHLLPNLHIVTNGKHIGSLVPDTKRAQHEQHQGHLSKKTAHNTEYQHSGHRHQHTEHEHQLSGHEHQHGGHEHQHSGHEHQHTGHEHQHTGHEHQHSGHERPHAEHERQHPAHEHQHSAHEHQHSDHSKSQHRTDSPEQKQAPDVPAQKQAPDIQPQSRVPEPHAVRPDALAPLPQQQEKVPDSPAPDQPEDQPSSLAAQHNGTMDTLKAAIDRARAGGRPLTIEQIGDSHIKFGTETPALAARLAADSGLQAGQLKYGSVGDVGKTASYAAEHPEEFLRNINRNTDLVVVSFGSNEAVGPVGSKYSHDYASLIRQIREKAPQAAIVMAGPTDGNYWNSTRHLPYLGQVTQAQEQVAAGVPDSTYIKVAPQMGSVAYMKEHGLMRSDNLHLTTKGYHLLGAHLADDIEAALKQ